ncbi:isopenicillin N synthase family dioxygenase [Corynebacterium freneyi]|uniref:Isopenicillin N synthase-like dioxygenase n=1 Tax=Corynebacterium freneyi TaxID=134034 RepID=A0ABS4U4U1_9CORY|nr:2-oxoglutarate and iron-dependent oxygenase domain-containing protein [Corynebacterium freneyi]MBP2331668.1 isopenicillin N synthase-like dioxygenase [Corynebacterium freneyi]QXA51878.1 isopenicillin N synthase family oxygenase [Corynebacterium freneyi]UBI02076.1 isopenicillin N synthase family oxygenase [Corynebacterium freneyi]WJZ06209.1 Deacetoxycephalosporin C synthase [Corynebacterium freneyi]
MNATTTTTTAADTDALPVVDLSRAGEPGFRDHLLRAAHEVGFFYLTGTGIPQETFDELFALAEEFFALPDDAKKKVENLASPHFRGWARHGGEYTNGEIDWREQIDIGIDRDPIPVEDIRHDYEILIGPNLWPEELPRFREAIITYRERLHDVARSLLHEWLAALGQDPGALDDAFADPDTLIKVIRYPGRSEDEGRQGVGAHKDSGILTLLLLAPGSTGLQVKTDSGWRDVPPREGSLVVNIGEMLELVTDGYLKATVHRVLSPEPGTTRLSIPLFFNPNYSATLERLPLPAELAREATGYRSTDDDVLHRTYGKNTLKFRVRSHPDVTAKHHPHLL